jgi:DNA-binding transcriptional MocR family regulator
LNPLPTTMDARILSLQQQAARRPDVITLSGGLPSNDLLPREALALALPAVHARPSDSAMQYGWPEGRLELRRWVAQRLVARGAAVEPDQVVITAGAQQALALAVAVLVKRGERVYVGSLTYPAVLDVIALHSGVPTARLDGAVLCYVMPAVGNPHGVDVPLSVQASILASGVPIIVDEAYAELRFDGVTPRPWMCAARDRV